MANQLEPRAAIVHACEFAKFDNVWPFIRQQWIKGAKILSTGTREGWNSDTDDVVNREIAQELIDIAQDDEANLGDLENVQFDENPVPREVWEELLDNDVISQPSDAVLEFCDKVDLPHKEWRDADIPPRLFALRCAQLDGPQWLLFLEQTKEQARLAAERAGIRQRRRRRKRTRAWRVQTIPPPTAGTTEGVQRIIGRAHHAKNAEKRRATLAIATGKDADSKIAHEELRARDSARSLWHEAEPRTRQRRAPRPPVPIFQIRARRYTCNIRCRYLRP